MRHIFFILLLSSCTHWVDFTKTLPAEIDLGEGEHPLLFVSRFDTSLVQFEDPLETATWKEAYRQLTKGLQLGFKDIASVRLVLTDAPMGNHRYRYTDEVVFEDSLQRLQLHKHYPGYYLLTLDLFNLDLIPYDQVEQDEFGYETRYYDYIAEAAITLFNPQGQVVDRILSDQSEVVGYRQISLGIKGESPRLHQYPKKASLLSQALGQEYARLYTTIEVPVSRFYYKGKELNEAAALMEAKRWTEARALLEPLTENSNPRIASKAAFNMAVVSEALGDQPGVEQWLQKAGK